MDTDTGSSVSPSEGEVDTAMDTAMDTEDDLRSFVQEEMDGSR